jgi:hypothetical protein
MLCKEEARTLTSAELSCLESVGLAVPWSQRTLCNPIDAIHSVGITLTDTVPMHTGAVVLHFVCDLDRYGVPPISYNCWSRILVINEQTISITVAIWIASRVCDLKVVVASHASVWPFRIKVRRDAEAIAPTLSGQSSVLT